MTIAITDSALRRMGVRAAHYVSGHSVSTVGRNAILVAETYGMPEGVERTLTRLYGRANTIDRGEVAYWVIDGSDVEYRQED